MATSLTRKLYLLFILFFIFLTVSSAQSNEIDFRYSPAYWYSPIGFADDTFKTLVDDRGRLVYDFGPGPYVKPSTTIEVSFENEQFSVEKQFLKDPLIPIVQTMLSGNQGQLHLKAFALPSASSNSNSFEVLPSHRLHGNTGTESWCHPQEEVDSAFGTVAWGTNRPITYELKIDSNKDYQVVLGLCESYRTKEGLRRLTLSVEGSGEKVVDPIQETGTNVPSVFVFKGSDENNDGKILVEVTSPSGDPNTILNAIWMFEEEIEINKNDLIKGNLNDNAILYIDAGAEVYSLSQKPRLDVLSASYDTDKAHFPVLNINTNRMLVLENENWIYSNNRPFVSCSESFKEIEKNDSEWRISFSKKTNKVTCIVQNGIVTELPTIPIDAEKQSIAYWESLPLEVRSKIIVPDTKLQHLLDASQRMILQARESVDGKLQYQPGMTLYRGLWMHDSAYFLDTMLTLGEIETSKEIIEGMLAYQQLDGGMEIMRPVRILRETPLMLWLMCRFALLSGDKSWFVSHWDIIKRGVQFIENLRNQTLVVDAPNYGLTPSGFADGGIQGVQPEYATTIWNIIALEEIISTSKHFGFVDEVETIETLLNRIKTSFEVAKSRDLQTDEHGNVFLPVLVGSDADSSVPQRGQWAILELLAQDTSSHYADSLFTGTLMMLEANNIQGIPHSVGWLNNGIWAYFGGFMVEAYLAQNHSSKAIKMFYDFANHASPLYSFPEEQMPVGVSERTAGDFPHIWANVMLLRNVVKLLVLEKKEQVVLFQALPPDWLSPNAEIKFEEIVTRFGKVSLHIVVSKTGREVRVEVETQSNEKTARKLLINWEGFKQAGFNIPRNYSTIDWNSPASFSFRKK